MGRKDKEMKRIKLYVRRSRESSPRRTRHSKNSRRCEMRKSLRILYLFAFIIIGSVAVYAFACWGTWFPRFSP